MKINDVNNGVILQWLHTNQTLTIGGYTEKSITFNLPIAITSFSFHYTLCDKTAFTMHEPSFTNTTITIIARNQWEKTSNTSTDWHTISIGF